MTMECPNDTKQAYDIIAGALKIVSNGKATEQSLDVGNGLIEQAVNASSYVSDKGAPFGIALHQTSPDPASKPRTNYCRFNTYFPRSDVPTVVSCCDIR